MLTIDGSEGEGGGQILRTSLSLAGITGRDFRMINIRKNRWKPGLMPQHLTGVKAMQQITGATVRGDSPGSMELDFLPGRTIPGDYTFDIRTAGSITLLLQTLLPPLLFANAPSKLILKGGTHVPFSPPYEYIDEVFLPMLRLLGIHVNSAIKQYGFYPKGGGLIEASFSPVKKFRPLLCSDAGELINISGTSGVSNLPPGIAERQMQSAKQCLEDRGLDSVINVTSVPSNGRGTYLFLKIMTDGFTSGFSSLGKPGKRAEAVGRESCSRLLSHLSTGRCLDPYLADQIVLYLSLADGRSIISTSCITNHLLTNLDVIRKFIAISCTLDGSEGSAGTITIEGGSI